MISWAHTKEMVANASGQAETFTPGYTVNQLYEIGEQMAPRNLDSEGIMESTSNIGIAQMYGIYLLI